MIDHYFWLICGAWCGIGSSLMIWFLRRRPIDRGGFTEEEVARFARGSALWVLVPALILFALQSSIDGDVHGAAYSTWPVPQKQLAYLLLALLALAFLNWVFRGKGATTISAYYGSFSNESRPWLTPGAIKLVSMAVVLANALVLGLEGCTN